MMTYYHASSKILHWMLTRLNNQVDVTHILRAYSSHQARGFLLGKGLSDIKLNTNSTIMYVYDSVTK